MDNFCPFERARIFFKLHGVEDFLGIKGAESAWRIRAKLAVRGSAKKPLIGLFEERSHQVVEMLDCTDHHPSINLAAKRVKEEMIGQGIIPYDDKRGDLRYLQFVVQRETGRVQLSFVINENQWLTPAVKKIETLAVELVKQDPTLWHSIWLNLNFRPGNRIFGDEWKLFHGERFLWERVCGTDVCFLPGSFGQANLDLFEVLMRDMKNFVFDQSQIVEFYAGVGVIGLCLAAHARWVQCIEINSLSETCFLEGKRRLPEDDAKRLSYLVGSAANTLGMIANADLAIVDPPRKGIDSNLLSSIKSSFHLKKLFYVSCGWASFERDALELLKEGWEITFARAYLFFPGTNHLETLAIFNRKGSV